jgi:hypothetical protein
MEKLWSLLANPLNRESEVVYLCYVRCGNPRHRECNRAVSRTTPLQLGGSCGSHTPRTTAPFLKEVDAAVASLIAPGESDLRRGYSMSS